MTIWKFKPGKLEQGINALYEALTGLSRNQKGFLGSMSLISQNDENTVTTTSIGKLKRQGQILNASSKRPMSL